LWMHNAYMASPVKGAYVDSLKKDFRSFPLL
jgi:hypothetical protein